MKTIKFKNLISVKTGKTVEIKVTDNFDMSAVEEAGRLGRESGHKLFKAFGKQS